MKKNWSKDQIPTVSVSGFLKAIERAQSKILYLQKDFPLSSFNEISFIRCHTINTNNYRELNKGRKIDISNEAAPSFTLETRGMFFPIDTNFMASRDNKLRVQPLEIHIEPNKIFMGEVIGFTDEGKWIYIKSQLETVTPFIYQRNHEKRKFDTFFKKITLTVQEINLLEWISETRFSERYYKECGYARCSDFREMGEDLMVIFKALQGRVQERHARIFNKLEALELFLETIVLDEIILNDSLSSDK
jgi:hypothetical protein